MSNDIHPTAVIEPGVELDGVKVGPFCVVKSGVHIGKGSILHGNCWVEGDTVMGEHNQLFPGAVIGTAPQDLKYSGEPSRVRIGSHNHFREASTVHRGTSSGHMETRIGSHSLFMANSHVAHDCVVGDHVIMAYSAALAGHVLVESYVTLGGMAGVHQFCRVGVRAFLSAGTMVGQDVPPFCIADGRRAGLAGINVVGLKRAGLSPERVMATRRVYREFYALGRTRPEAIAAVEAIGGEEAKIFLDFVKSSQRGVLRARRDVEGEDEAKS